MNAILLVILIIIGNLSLYWLLFGKKKLDEKMCPPEPVFEPQPEKTIPEKIIPR
ncbi:MAG: hypothetical protein AABY26_03220 [Nanoarchaeota archaeon]